MDDVEAKLQHWRAMVNARPERGADAICEAVAVAVSNAVAQGELAAQLRQAGWMLVHVGNGYVPPAPAVWLQEGLEVMDPGLHDPLELLEGLWATAWEQGRRAGVGLAEEGVEIQEEVPELLSTSDVAVRLGISRQAVAKQALALGGMQVGSAWVFSAARIGRAIRERDRVDGGDDA